MVQRAITVGGSGSGVDVYNPDGNYGKGQSDQSWFSVTTTQKPKYIVHVTVRTSNGATRITFMDVDNQTAYGKKYDSNGYYDDSGSWSDYIRNVTTTSFEVRPATSTSNYNMVFWWY